MWYSTLKSHFKSHLKENKELNKFGKNCFERKKREKKASEKNIDSDHEDEKTPLFLTSLNSNFQVIPSITETE